MRAIIIAGLLMVFGVQLHAQASSIVEEIKDLSKAKWEWMAEKNVDKLIASTPSLSYGSTF